MAHWIYSQPTSGRYVKRIIHSTDHDVGDWMGNSKSVDDDNLVSAALITVRRGAGTEFHFRRTNSCLRALTESPTRRNLNRFTRIEVVQEFFLTFEYLQRLRLEQRFLFIEKFTFLFCFPLLL